MHSNNSKLLIKPGQGEIVIMKEEHLQNITRWVMMFKKKKVSQKEEGEKADVTWQLQLILVLIAENQLLLYSANFTQSDQCRAKCSGIYLTFLVS